MLGIFGDLSACDKSAALMAGEQAKNMIRLGIKAFTDRDVALANKVKQMDDLVDKTYTDFVSKAAHNPDAEVKCTVSGSLILRYLERIADHATYIGESVLYIVSGERTVRK